MNVTLPVVWEIFKGLKGNIRRRSEFKYIIRRNLSWRGFKSQVEWWCAVIKSQCLFQWQNKGVNTSKVPEFKVEVLRCWMIADIAFYFLYGRINPEVIVILMTAYTAPDLIMEAQKAGVYECLTKPFNPSRLLDIIARLYREKKEILKIKGKKGNAG